MSIPNPKKRPAPGSTPVPVYSQPQLHAYPSNAAGHTSDADMLSYNQGPSSTGYAANAGKYGTTDFGVNGVSQNGFDSNRLTQSIQLARRPYNRQIIQNNQQNTIGVPSSPWEGVMDSQMGHGVIEDNDSIEALEERAAKANKAAKAAGGSRKQIPPFVQKLSSFLDQSRNTDLIRWSECGDSFIVLDEDEFARTLIPELFKHNNYASFVRQLNMYGFHKRVGLSDHSMRASERKNKSPSEYYNQYFKRGHPDLLWLVNKPPKSGPSKRPTKKKAKPDEIGDGDSFDEIDGIEETFGSSYNNNMQTTTSRALSIAPEGQLPERDLALQQQLTQVQQKQGFIFGALSRLQHQQNQIVNETRRFQELHDRHDSSINSILTFLATVYNRSLDGQSPQNLHLSQLFSSGMIPQDRDGQQNGNVVELGEFTSQQQQHRNSVSPNRRAQRLLMAPSNAGGPANSTTSNSAAASPAEVDNVVMNKRLPMQRSNMIEEVFDSPGDTTSPQSVKLEAPGQHPQQNMMNLINTTNAQSRHSPAQTKGMEFPEMLSHYENANGQTPLSEEERNNMLSLISHTVSGTTSDALTSPAPPTPPNFGQDLSYSAAELDALLRMQTETGGQIEDIEKALNNSEIPLSPNGFDGIDGNVDLDQYFDPGAYYDEHSPLGLSRDVDHLSGFDDRGDGSSGLDLDVLDGFGVRNNEDQIYRNGREGGGSVVETMGSSGGGTPEPTGTSANFQVGEDSAHQVASKKRRKA